MANFFYQQDVKVIAWRRNNITVKADTKEEADKIMLQHINDDLVHGDYTNEGIRYDYNEFVGDDREYKRNDDEKDATIVIMDGDHIIADNGR